MAYIDVSTLPGISLIAGIDPDLRDIHLSSNTMNTELNPIDVYKEMRIARRLNESLRPYDVFLSAFGNAPKGGGKFTERYVVQNSGTRIIPYDATHQLSITGTIITDDGQEGTSCFDRGPLDPATVVDINYVPPQVEVIVVAGGSGLDADQDLKLTEIHSGSMRMVHIDTTLIAYGDGSPTAPFNTVAAAVAYAHVKGIHALHIHNNCVLDADVENFEIHGLTQPLIDLNGFSIESTDFFNCQISGTGTTTVQGATFRHCNIMNGATGISGIYHECAISGDVFLKPGGYAIFSSCFSGIPGSSRPSIDMGSDGTSQLAFRAWSGGLEIRNMVDGDALTVEMTAGECRLAVSCTGGDCHVRGDGYFENLGTTNAITRSLNVGQRQTEIWKRLDLDAANPNTYADDASSIANNDFTLTRTDNGNGTSTVQRS